MDFFLLANLKHKAGRLVEKLLCRIGKEHLGVLFPLLSKQGRAYFAQH